MMTADSSALAARLNLVGSSPLYQKLLRMAAHLAPLPLSVLLLGETGTGKSTLARFIHEASPYARRKFVSFNCAAIPDDLLESIFFGSERGAFTGAGDKAGLFEQAAGGTLFLDEIGELTASMQAKLLTAIETKSVRRVGATRDIKCEVRLICATHRPLSIFRPDFLHRINRAPLEIPPLRQRLEDLPEVISHLFARAQRELGATRPFIVKSASFPLFAGYEWPGNIREVENFVLKVALASLTTQVVEPEVVADCLARHRRTTAGIAEAEITSSLRAAPPLEQQLVIPPYLLQHKPGEPFDVFTARVLVSVHDYLTQVKGLTKTATGQLLGIERSVLAARIKYAKKVLREHGHDPDALLMEPSPSCLTFASRSLLAGFPDGRMTLQSSP